MNGSVMGPTLGQVPLAPLPGPRWGWYGGRPVRWPECDPRYDAQCPYPTTFIVAGPRPFLGQGVVAGFGGPGGFAGGPGGLVAGGPPGPVQAVAPGGSPSYAGGGFPCGPAGYGPTCAVPISPSDVMGPGLGVRYPVANLGKGPVSDGTAARGRDNWEHPMAPCPPGFFRSSPGSPCVAYRSQEDWGEDYWTYGDLDRYVDATFRR